MVPIQQLDLHRKRVLVRADLNVAVENGEISSAQRLEASLDTIRYALDAKAAVMVTSHFGRPQEGVWESQFSLAPIGARMQQMLDYDVRFVSDWIDGIDVEPGEVVLCENVRFLPGETANASALSQKLAALCDVFVLDAFGAAHRTHASLVGVANYAKAACVGLQCQKEIKALAKGLKDPASPVVAIVGGAKVQGKLQALRQLSELAEVLIVGGGIANTFVVASGFSVGGSLYDPELIDEAQAILGWASQNGCHIFLPQDVIVAPSLDSRQQWTAKKLDEVTSEDMIFDFGEQSCAAIASIVKTARTIIWNGPLGAFEYAPFDAGTRQLSQAVADSDAFSIAGGGDTLAALEKFGLEDAVSYASTGGGAFLEFVQGNELPAFVALEEHAAQMNHVAEARLIR